MTQGRHISVDDELLVQRWRQGDPAAPERLIAKYQNRIYNLIFKICANPDDAAELVQDTFVKIIENIGGFERRSSFYTWAFRIAVNLTLNHCKRKAAIGFASLEAPPVEDQQAGQVLGELLRDKKTPDPAVVAENRELCELIEKALGKLDNEQRVIIVLRDIEEMDYAEIAEVLGLELGTVKSRLSRARAALAQILEVFSR